MRRRRKLTSWKRIQHSFKCILAKVGNPPIELVRASEFKERTGWPLGESLGKCWWGSEGNLVCVKRNLPLESIKKTIWHEIGHILFRSKPHWWIECYGTKMSGFKSYKHYATKYGHSEDELPSKKRLLELSRRSAERMKSKEESNVRA